MGADLKARVLSALRQREGFLSGQELCDDLGVSRTAVWKAIGKLKEDGYVVEGVSNRGYRLVSSPELLSGEELESRLSGKWAGGRLIFLSQVDSTNTEAKRQAEAGAEHGTLVVTEQQTGGKGRRGRGWNSPAGTNIYMTLVLRPDFYPDMASMLTLVMALSVAEGIEKASGVECGIKWPNDIVIGGKKVCGILTEMSAEPDFIHYVVTGAGINVNQDSFPGEIADVATSLFLQSGRKYNRADMIAEVMDSYERNYDTFVRYRDLRALKDSYDRKLVNRDREVRVLDPAGEYEGIARGITEKGELLVERKDGAVETVYAGEVSVRGIYGYV